MMMVIGMTSLNSLVLEIKIINIKDIILTIIIKVNMAADTISHNIRIILFLEIKISIDKGPVVLTDQMQLKNQDNLQE